MVSESDSPISTYVKKTSSIPVETQGPDFGSRIGEKSWNCDRGKYHTALWGPLECQWSDDHDSQKNQSSHTLKKNNTHIEKTCKDRNLVKHVCPLPYVLTFHSVHGSSLNLLYLTYLFFSRKVNYGPILYLESVLKVTISTFLTERRMSKVWMMRYQPSNKERYTLVPFFFSP